MTTLEHTYRNLHQALTQLASHTTEHMTKSTDIRYQGVCAWACNIAALLYDPDLEQALQIAALTCHTCIKETA